MLLFMDGFDHYATADITKKWTGLNGSIAIDATAGRRGGGALKCTGGSNQYVTKTIAATASLVCGFSFSETLLPSAAVKIVELLDGATAQVDLRINPDGTLSVTRAGTALTNGTSVFALGTSISYYIEWKVTIADSIGASTCVVKVNGAVVITVATGQDTKATSNASVSVFKLGTANSQSNTPTVLFDDFYLCDLTGSTNNDFLGDVRIDTVYPNADGNYSQFTCSTGSSHYVLVDETAPNTSDHNDGSTVNDRDSYAMGNLSALVSQTVYGVQVNAACLKDDAGAKSASTFVRSSSTNGDGASVPLGTSQSYISQIYETDPNGSIAWTESSVNAMEAGVKVTA